MRRKTLIMGVMNVTPDSFFDGGQLASQAAVRARAEAMLADGADWLDVGGESSRPGAEPVGAEEEQRRVLPALDALRGLGARISVDTYRASTARAALAHGAAMVNDITALRGDPAMAETVAEAGCPVVLMHMRGTPQTMQRDPQYDDVIDDLCQFFDERIAHATAAGIREERIWLDPGFGFGKTVAHNLTLVRQLDAFHRFGRPLLLGPSNKSTIGAILHTEVDDRREGTAAAVALAIARGVHCVRVHDVQSMGRVARMADAIVYGHHGQQGG